MPNLNKVFLMGHITRDITLSYLPSQTALADFALAINRKWKATSGEAKEEVCFVDCQAFGKTGETINKYCKKGEPIFIEGRLKFDQWEAKDGSKHSKHRVIVDHFQFLSNKGKPTATEPSPENAEDDIPF